MVGVALGDAEVCEATSSLTLAQAASPGERLEPGVPEVIDIGEGFAVGGARVIAI